MEPTDRDQPISPRYREFAKLLNVALAGRRSGWLAWRVGVSPDAVKKWRAGLKRPTKAALGFVASALPEVSPRRWAEAAEYDPDRFEAWWTDCFESNRLGQR